MALWQQLSRGLRTLARRQAADAELHREIEHYFEETVSAWEARGLSPDEARRQARLEVGSPLAIRDAVRHGGWEHAIETLAGDLRHGVRQWRRARGLAALAIVTFALGIGGTTAVFSAVKPILLDRLPLPDSDRLVSIWEPRPDGTRVDLTFGTHLELLSRSRSFDAIAVARHWQPILTGVGDAERLDGQRVSARYFTALGIAPVLGRDFDEDEDRVNGPAVVLLSHDLWRRRFAGDRTIIGRLLTLDGRPHAVVGVMPPAFEDVLAPPARVWAPLQYDRALPRDGREWGHHLRMIARLHPGVTPVAANRELNEIAANPIAAFARPPWASLTGGIAVLRLQDDLTRAVRPALAAFFGAVLLVLAIAAVNVTNLLLVRAAQRERELAMRLALGAGRLRVARQLLAEGLVLVTLGGVAGVATARVTVDLLVALGPPDVPRLSSIAVDAAVLIFACGVTLLVGIGVSLLPVLQAFRGGIHDRLQQQTSRVAAHHHWRRALVVCEVALAVVLLVSAGLLLRSLARVVAIAPGFDPAGVLAVQVQASRHLETTTTFRLFEQGAEAVRGLPGVLASGLVSQVPLSGEVESRYGVQLEGEAMGGASGEDGSALRYAVDAGYFETLRIPLGRGRLLTPTDRAGTPPVAVISETLARRFRGADPIGRRIHVGRTDWPWYTIVGIVGDVKHVSLTAESPAAVYVPMSQWYFADASMWIVARGAGHPAALTPSIRDAIRGVDPNQPIVRVATLTSLLERAAAERRFALLVFGLFGVVAILLTATGLYGVLAGSVAERRREIGVRAALGARRRTILAMVLRQAGALTALGIAIGTGGAAFATRALQALLYDTSRFDLATHLLAMLAFAAVAALAAAVPAARALSIDPAVTLRAE